MEEYNSLESRISLYDKYYGFIENPDDFNFEYNPHRLIVKNYALRTKDRNSYYKYLDEYFSHFTKIELNNFDYEVRYIRQFDHAELLAWLSTNNVKVLESDISFEDPDAIFKMISVSNSESPTLYTLEGEDYILNRILPRDLIKSPNKTWINIKKI
ncbi:hypothetical protein SF1_14210 [Sphingobacterium faecium NBRC 15299]|uniref:hypothetical protein n=1 Tax=Sphingobacterium faecium TaxID=34087 RepID=UPI000D3BE25D|nr:hypothetical protein [Sphingobacterium faecium]PTX11777.1 hypothetical protein C8N37_103354 [Sphingobacterium faecium]GEM63439.1 hypothetical protein SF1_14210 [Sphingobacterium faecium NBRC 15299]